MGRAITLLFRAVLFVPVDGAGSIQGVCEQKALIRLQSGMSLC